MTYDEDNLKPQPSAIHNQPLPLNMFQPNGIKYRRRENRCPAKELKDSNPLGALRKWKQLDQESCGSISILFPIKFLRTDSL